ncbi:GDSL-type esterase/lipase family protein [Clostridium sp.]|uniref:GDSL-type esterase/lipase family protein n=1 Tax=Clostridium sp. TaxID=1506 RepID=UPI002621661C|nr:GDSL-type esterase/lipase family protein [Clostridium sp.]
MRRKILSIITLIMSFYIIFSFIIGMLNGVFKNKNKSKKDYLVQLENQPLDDLQNKIDTYHNDILNTNNNILSNEDMNYSKYYENTIFMGDSITEALSEFGILDSYNVIANKGDTVIKASQNIDKLQGINPKNLVLLYGMNDVIAFDSNSSQESSNAFKENYIELINSIKAVLPKTNIYLISPLPVMNNAVNTNYRLTNENLNEFRLKVAEVSTATGSTYIDLASVITEKDYLHEQDGIHYKYDFYTLWLDLLKNYIQ